MGSRLIFSVVLALAAFGTSIESRADGYAPGYRSKHYQSHVSRRRLRSYGYRGGVGGWLFGWQLKPFSFSGEAYNYPGHYNNQTFWERVQTQPNYPVQY